MLSLPILAPQGVNSGSIEEWKSWKEQNKAASNGTSQVKNNPFPVNAFPAAVQNIILETNECLNFPIDFIGASLMHVAAVAIGNSHATEVKKGWQECPVLFTALVGRPGTNKSHPLSFALLPIEAKDKRAFQEYERQKQEADFLKGLSAKERDRQGLPDPVEPHWQKIIVSDVTPEGIAQVHNFNRRGIALYVDELASWFKNFNRYNKGSEETFWLSTWTGKPINIDRKFSGSTLIQKPFIPVIGTIQNGVLKDLSGGDRGKNGFLDRILFVMPDQLKKPYWNEKELHPQTFENWYNIITNILDLPCSLDETGTPNPVVLSLNSGAKARFIEWYNKAADLLNESEGEALAGTLAKLELYLLRFSLILQLMKWACGEADRQEIEIAAVEGAILLTTYFQNTALKVQELVLNPLAHLSENKQLLYEALPQTFTTGEAMARADEFGIKRATFFRFLDEKDLFKRLTHGTYEKLI